MALKILSGGVVSLVVDRGRRGWMHQGFSPSGALDMRGFEAACMLVEPNATNAIEAMVGFCAKFEKDTVAAIAGADLYATLDGVALGTDRAFLAPKGSILKLTKIKKGMRAYIAVAGGFVLPQVKGSVSASIREAIGSILSKGDSLAYVAHKRYQWHRLRYPVWEEAIFQKPIRIVAAYHHKEFPLQAIEAIGTKEFSVGVASGRMACVLEGGGVQSPLKEFLSEPNCFGAVQVLKDGKIAVLLSERQSIGGYAKIGVVVADDCYKLAQMAPGSSVRFVWSRCDHARF